MTADRYRDLFENSADPILIIEGGIFTDCNKAAHEMLDYPDKRGIIGKHPWDISPEFQPDGQRSEDKGQQMLATFATETHQSFEWIHTRADGTTFPVEVSLVAIQGDTGRRLHCAWRDVTERKVLERELRHAQKMDAIGKLAGAVAHDFNNQLVPITGYADLLKDALEDGSEPRKWAQEISRAASLSTALVQKLLAFSRKIDVEPVVQDVNRRITDMLAMLRELLGDHIDIGHRPASAPQWVLLGEGDIEQIVLNIVINSRDAMPDGGDLNIEISPEVRGNQPGVRICIADDGSGMDPETLKRMFEPFFTTKDLGCGTGLGMSTVRELVVNAGGRINAKSVMGRGTSVEVWLPRSDSEGDRATVEPQEKRELDGRGWRILVIEDNPQVADFVVEALRQMRFDVEVARNARVALAKVEERPPHLILTDVMIRGASGPALIRRLLNSGIDIPYIFMSGTPGDKLAQHGFDPSSVALLRKPFTISTLTTVVRDALRGR